MDDKTRKVVNGIKNTLARAGILEYQDIVSVLISIGYDDGFKAGREDAADRLAVVMGA